MRPKSHMSVSGVISDVVSDVVTASSTCRCDVGVMMTYYRPLNRSTDVIV